MSSLPPCAILRPTKAPALSQTTTWHEATDAIPRIGSYLTSALQYVRHHHATLTADGNYTAEYLGHLRNQLISLENHLADFATVIRHCLAAPHAHVRAAASLAIQTLDDTHAAIHDARAILDHRAKSPSAPPSPVLPTSAAISRSLCEHIAELQQALPHLQSTLRHADAIPISLINLADHTYDLRQHETSLAQVASAIAAWMPTASGDNPSTLFAATLVHANHINSLVRNSIHALTPMAFETRVSAIARSITTSPPTSSAKRTPAH